MFLVFTVILVALIFTYTNGFHDTANAIATVVGTKVLTPRQAILLATVTNLLGAMTGAAVAKTIASGLVDTKFIPPEKLRFLQYVTPETRDWWKAHEAQGAVLLGKAAI